MLQAPSQPTDFQGLGFRLYLSSEQDCWDSLSPPDNLGTLSAIMTKNLGQQCRSEVQGLLGDLYEECTKIEGSSEKDCLKELFWWFFGYTGAGYRAGWYQKLAATPREAMLWAGFYDGSPLGLTQKALQSFSNMVDTSIVHPSSILGKIVQRNHDLLGCRGDIGAWRPCCCVKGTVSAIDKGPVCGLLERRKPFLRAWHGFKQSVVGGGRPEQSPG